MRESQKQRKHKQVQRRKLQSRRFPRDFSFFQTLSIGECFFEARNKKTRKVGGSLWLVPRLTSQKCQVCLVRSFSFRSGSSKNSVNHLHTKTHARASQTSPQPYRVNLTNDNLTCSRRNIKKKDPTLKTTPKSFCSLNVFLFAYNNNAARTVREVCCDKRGTSRALSLSPSINPPEQQKSGGTR